MALFDLRCWPASLVFALAGVMAAFFAFVSVNLFAQAMANVGFIRGFGWEAIRHGALWQALELMCWGAASLLCWLVFKLCEAELVSRYRGWTGARTHRDRPPDQEI